MSGGGEAAGTEEGGEKGGGTGRGGTTVAVCEHCFIYWGKEVSARGTPLRLRRAVAVCPQTVVMIECAKKRGAVRLSSVRTQSEASSGLWMVASALSVKEAALA